jgi:hypothetical protein
MKKTAFLLAAILTVASLVAFNRYDEGGKPTFIPPSEQKTGDAAKGYEYLTTGNFIKSGFPYDFFLFANGKGKNYLGRTGKNANVDHGFNVITNEDSLAIVIPTCLQCHAEVFEGKLCVGLGNVSVDFRATTKRSGPLALLKQWQLTAPKKYKAVKSLITSMTTVYPLMETEVRGVNSADRLAAILVAHRDPQTLVWNNKALIDLPDAVVPTDVPAWWLLKKKNAMFYNGFGRGDFSKFLMLSNILTVSDTNEAREVYSHFGDVLAYIRSLQPPPYPKTVNKDLAEKGKKIFNNTCSGCHGTYGAEGAYPNLLIAGPEIKTDSLLFMSNQQAKPFVEWFNTSWFAQEPNAARLVPGNGYVAPPLDGVWITAPYLHNGSVPTIEAVLNSRLRPTYWTRNFDKPEYDYEHLGWKYQVLEQADGRNAYNTTLPGYGNYGHYFGDKLSDEERKSVIEYLKIL